MRHFYCSCCCSVCGDDVVLGPVEFRNVAAGSSVAWGRVWVGADASGLSLAVAAVSFCSTLRGAEGSLLAGVTWADFSLGGGVSATLRAGAVCLGSGDGTSTLRAGASSFAGAASVSMGTGGG